MAQLVEHDLAKVGVAGSNPVCRLKAPEINVSGVLLFPEIHLSLLAVNAVSSASMPTAGAKFLLHKIVAFVRGVYFVLKQSGLLENYAFLITTKCRDYRQYFVL